MLYCLYKALVGSLVKMMLKNSRLIIYTNSKAGHLPFIQSRRTNFIAESVLDITTIYLNLTRKNVHFNNKSSIHLIQKRLSSELLHCALRIVS